MGRGHSAEDADRQAYGNGSASAAPQECPPIDRARDRSGLGLAAVMVTHDVPSAEPFAFKTSNFYAKAGAKSGHFGAKFAAYNVRQDQGSRERCSVRFFSLLPPSAGRFASLLPSLRVGSGVSLELLIPKGYRV
jgi:hypothetical protein